VTSVTSASPVARRRRNFALTLIIVAGIGILIYYVVLSLLTDSVTAARQVANALTLGAIYALVALGYTMVYGIIELINFAHGDVFTFGAFVSMIFLTSGLGWTDGTDAIGIAIGILQLGAIGLWIGLALTRGLGIKRLPYVVAAIAVGIAIMFVLDAGVGAQPNTTSLVRLVGTLAIAFVVAMVTMAALNVTIERLAYRRLRHAPKVAPLITAIGMSFILLNVMQIWQGVGDRSVPRVFPTNEIVILGARVPVLNLFIIVVAIVLIYALQTFVTRTRLGRAMRSTAQDQQAAQLMGVDLNQTIAMTFLLGGALAGAAGVFQGIYFGFVRFDLGFNAGLKAFTAAVLGGIGNLAGAAIGGFCIAFVEVFAAAVGQQRWSQAIVFLVLIIVLVFRPAGILGQQLGERA
jgi:branched-chain amino acid transport system permease protein